MIINDPMHTLENAEKDSNAKVLRNDRYQYMWSLNGERKSNILNYNYPKNYIDDIKKVSNEGYDVIIDVSSDSILKKIDNELSEVIYDQRTGQIV